MHTKPSRIFVFSHRNDESRYFEALRDAEGFDLGTCPDGPSAENLDLAAGYPCVSVVTTPIGSDIVAGLRERGVEFISTRTIGYDHIDIAAAKSLGMRIGNAPYGPDGVANYAVMLMLMATRRVKTILAKIEVQDFTLAGAKGVELRDLVIGVAGTGRIGRTVLRNLSGFGCRLLAYDPAPAGELPGGATYVDWETLLAESDILSLHMPATAENRHVVGKEAFSRMKDGAYLINTARGSLVDTAALADAVESGKLSGAALDVVENESRLYYHDRRWKPLKNRDLALLRSYPNVIVTPHMAFYTEEAVRDMAENSIRSCLAHLRGEDNPWEVRL